MATLVANSMPNGVTGGNDTALTYTKDALDSLDGNDTITANTATAIQSVLASGGRIDGGAGVDTLKLAAGTQLDLTAITGNQTVKPIQEVEVFEMQGGSSRLTLSANSVLSLGGANLSGYDFTTVSNAQGGGTSSTGKVQFVVNGQVGDSLVLNQLATDGVSSNGVLGNTGLAGVWTYKGDVVKNGITYKVYDHSTTQAQALVDSDVNVSFTDTTPPTATITLSDTVLAANETAVVTITFSEAVTGLTAGDFVVENGTISNPVSTDGGITWTATFTPNAGVQDTTNVIKLNAGGVTDAAGNANALTTSANYVVDTVPPIAPTIIVYNDNVGAQTGDFGTGTSTDDATPTLKGTAEALSTVTLYNGSTVLGTTTADGNGAWSFTPNALTEGTYAITAKATDAAGNTSAASSAFNLTVMLNTAPVASTTTLSSPLAAATAPTLTITDNAAGETANSTAVTYTFTFSEAPTGFTASDIQVTNGTLQAGTFTQVNATTWTANVTTADSGTGTTIVRVTDGAYTSAAGVDGMGATASQAYNAVTTTSGKVSSTFDGTNPMGALEVFYSRSPGITNVATGDADNEFSMFSGGYQGTHLVVHDSIMKTGQRMTAFSASQTWDMQQYVGMSFSFGKMTGGDRVNEYPNGYKTGLAISYRPYNHYVELIWNNVVVARTAYDTSIQSRAADTMTLTVSETGQATVTFKNANPTSYADIVLSGNLSDWTTANMDGWHFAYQGMTGGAFDAPGWIDDVAINWTSTDVPAGYVPSVVNGVGTYRATFDGADPLGGAQIVEGGSGYAGSNLATADADNEWGFTGVNGYWASSHVALLNDRLDTDERMKTFNASFDVPVFAAADSNPGLVFYFGDQSRQSYYEWVSTVSSTQGGVHEGLSFIIKKGTMYIKYGSTLTALGTGADFGVSTDDKVNISVSESGLATFTISSLSNSSITPYVLTYQIPDWSSVDMSGWMFGYVMAAPSGGPYTLDNVAIDWVQNEQAPTVTGTSGADTLIGTETADVITAGGGADTVFAAAGNDSVSINASNVTALGASNTMLLDGGMGINTLKLADSGATLDLTNATVAAKVRSFSSIDLTGTGNNTLQLDAATVARMGQSLANASGQFMVVNGNTGDALQLAGNWTQGGTASGATLAASLGSAQGFVAGTQYIAYTQGSQVVYVAQAVSTTQGATATSTQGLITSAATVADLYQSTFTDVNTDQGFKGVVVVGNSVGYEWFNGSTWTALPATSDTAAVFLAPSTQLRYNGSLAGANATTAGDLQVRLVDTSGVTGSASLVSGSVVDLAQTGVGGSTAYSDEIVTLQDGPSSNGGNLVVNTAPVVLSGAQTLANPLQSTASLAPKLTITDNVSASSAANSSDVTFTFTFNEAVSGFTADDVSISAGTKGAFTQVSDTQYTLVVTAPATGSDAIGVSVASGSYTSVSTGVAGQGATASQYYGAAPAPAGTDVLTAGSPYLTYAAHYQVGDKTYLVQRNSTQWFGAGGSPVNSVTTGAVSVVDSATGAILSTNVSSDTLTSGWGDKTAGVSLSPDSLGNFYITGARNTNGEIVNGTLTLTRVSANGVPQTPINYSGITGVYMTSNWLIDDNTLAVVYTNGSTVYSLKVNANTGDILEGPTALIGGVSTYRNLNPVLLADGSVVLTLEGDFDRYVKLMHFAPGSLAPVSFDVDFVYSTGDIKTTLLSNGKLAVLGSGVDAFSGYALKLMLVNPLTQSVDNLFEYRISNVVPAGYTYQYSYPQDVVQLKDGSIVIVATASVNATSKYGVFAMIVNPDGSVKVPFFMVDEASYPENLESFSLLALDNGGFQVSYQDQVANPTYTSEHSLKVMNFGPTGTLMQTGGASNATDTFTGGDLDDTFTANGGADRILAGAGNDTVIINNDNLTQLGNSNTMLLGGGTGINTLTLSTTSAGTLDLTSATVASKVGNFGVFNLGGSTGVVNTLKLDPAAVARMGQQMTDNANTMANEAKMVVVNGDGGATPDALQLVGSWTQGATASGASLAASYGSAWGFVSGTNYVAYSYQGATVFVASGVSVSNNATPTAGAAATLTDAATVASLFEVAFSDANAGQSFKGVVVTGNSAGYEWFNGSSWTALPSSTGDSAAVFLAADTLVRYNGPATPGALTVRLVDDSGASGSASLVSGSVVNVTTNGGSTAYSGTTSQLVIDTTAPTGTTVASYADNVGASQPTAAVSGSVTDDATPTFTGAAEAGSTVKVYAGNTLLGTTTANASGAWTLTPATPFAQGSYQVQATATDASGNISSPSTAFTVTVDTNDAPVITSTSLTPAAGTLGNSFGYVSDTPTTVNGVTVQATQWTGAFAITAAGESSGSYWQYYNGSSWVNITSASVSSALYLDKNTLVRWGGSASAYASLSVVAVDNTGTDNTGGTLDQAERINVSIRGGDTAFSQQVATLQGVLPPATAQAITFNVPTSINEGSVLVGTVTLSGGNGNPALTYSISGSATLSSADYASAVFSNGVTLNANGTFNVPAGVTSFTITLPIVADKLTEGLESLTMTVGSLSKSVNINDTSTATSGGPVVSPTYAINGATATDNSGWTVSNAGDVNGDGLDDVIVGASRADVGSNSDAGKAYVVFGRTGTPAGIDLSAVAQGSGGFVINGALAGDQIGQVVSAAGDINGDGLADVLVVSSSPSNKAYVVYGTTATSPVNLSSLATAATSQGFSINSTTSTSVAYGASAAGDVNGDGFADLILLGNNQAFVAFGSSAQANVQLSNVVNGSGGFHISGMPQGGVDAAVSAAGDFNGDGLTDLIVGNPGSTGNNTGSNTGSSYLIYGTTSTATVNVGTMQASQGFAIHGQTTNEYSGTSVSAAGDVNGDGLADVIVGSYMADPSTGRLDAGRSYVVFGTSGQPAKVDLSAIATGTNSNGFVINGQCDSDQSGYSVSSAGDINGDGLADLVVGAYFATWNGGPGTGRTYVVYGKTGSTAVELSAIVAGSGGFVITGQCSNDRFGASVSAAGDVNGDGYADLIVGARYADTSGDNNAGKSYIIYGGPQYLSGYVATGTGTVFDELVVGTGGNDTLQGGGGVDRFSAGAGNDTIVLTGDDITNLGNTTVGGVKAYVQGGAGYDSIQLSGGAILDLTKISNAGGMTGDTGEQLSRVNSVERIDLATDAAANMLTLTATDVKDMAGFNLIRTGTVSADGKTWTNLSGTALAATTSYHQMVVDGNGLDKLLLSPDTGTWNKVGQVSNGSTNYWVYQNEGTRSQVLVNAAMTVYNNDPYTAPVGPVAPTYAINGQSSNDQSSFSVSNAGDVNGDGLDDVIIGAPTDRTAPGRAYVVFGQTGTPTGIDLSAVANGTGGFVIQGEAATQAGYSVSAAGDVNGDGLADVIVGANSSNKAYVVYGTAATTAINLSAVAQGSGGFVISSTSASSPVLVSSAGDVNGDGQADMLVQQNSETYVVFGSNTQSSINLASWSSGAGGYRISGLTSPGSVSSAGDFNGDGLADIIIGDPYRTSNTGASYVIYGTTASATSVNVTSLAASQGFAMNGQATGDTFGYSVSAAGDVNGDGLADVVIGAWSATSNAGRSYVVFGTSGAPASINMASIVAGIGGFAINGQSNDRAGTSVSSAGDINGDGLDDLIIGAPAAGSVAGRTYVVYGKASTGVVQLSDVGSGNGGFVINSPTTGDSFGFSVSSAGDLNGDGFADMIVGARYASPLAGSSAGKSYIIYGGSQYISGTVALGAGTFLDELVVGTAGNDTLTGGGGLDRFTGGAGNDTVELAASDVSNLGSTTAGVLKAYVDGGTGYDTLRLNGSSLNLTQIRNAGAMTGATGEQLSRISSVERIDLTSDAAANTLTLTSVDVNDMAGVNLIRTGSASADGKTWTNVSGSALGASTNYHQLVVDGDSLDKLVIGGTQGGWVQVGVVSNGTTQYQVIQNAQTQSQLIVDTRVQVLLQPNTYPTAPINLTATALTNGGYDVSYAGDVNGDGIDDLIVSAYPSSITPNTKTYVVFGNTANLMPLNLATMSASQGFAINDANGGMQAVHYAGDLNGDGLADLIVGRPVEGSNSGAVYVVYGKSDGTTVTIGSSMGTSGFMINGNIGSEQFGSDVSTAGDFNGDGVADLLVGASASGGSAYVIYSNKIQGGAYTSFSDLTSAGALGLALYNGGTGFGNSVTNLGDINGDGLSDVLVGGNGSINQGMSYVVFGRTASGSLDIGTMGTAGFKILGNATSEYANNVAGAGDVNGDGVADLLVGAYGTNKAYVVFGGASLAGATITLSNAGGTTPGFTIVDNLSGSFGTSVSYAGDFNGDGLADLVVGANTADPTSGTDAGRSYVVYGKASNTTVYASDLRSGVGGFVINGATASGQAGFSVSNGGDLNGDGYADLLVGAKGVGTNGSTYVIYGGPQYVSGSIALGTGTSADELVVGTAGADTLTGAGGLDRFSAGAGSDTMVLTASDVSNLGSNTGTARAFVDGGTGYDTVRLDGSATLNLGSITHIDSLGGMDMSRINSVERIDLNAANGQANTLTLTAADVNDMAEFNTVRLGTGDDGRTWSSGTYTLQSTMKYHQLVVDGGSTDAVTLAAGTGYWKNMGTVTGGNTTYTVYQNDGTNSQVLVANGVNVTNSDAGPAAGDPVISLGTSGNLISPLTVEGRTYYVWDVNGDGQITQTGDGKYTMDGFEQQFFGSSSGMVVTNSNRTFTVNGVTLRLPTSGDAYGSNKYFSGTAVNSPTVTNNTYDDFAAIWDAYNGTSTATNVAATYPAGTAWALASGPGYYYWTSTVSGSTHMYFDSNAGSSNINRADNATDIPIYFAFEVVSVASPIVFDLNRDGTISYTQQLMDVNTDGKLDFSAWAAKQDGVLVWNKFGDGLVHDQSQYAFTLYGGNTDLEGLRVGFDSNGDGVLDAQDAKFAEFGVWQDANGNGVADAGEFHSLTDLGVKAIHLTSDGVASAPAAGVTEAGRTTVEMTDGSTLVASDAAFTFNTVPVLNLDAVIQAGVANMVDGQAQVLKLTANDLLHLSTQADGMQQLKVLGDSQDAVTLDQLTANGQQGTWSQSGTVTQDGQLFNVYQNSADPLLQVLIDQHIAQSNVHAG